MSKTKSDVARAVREDFMFKDYSAIREPLNLEASGRSWFEKVFARAPLDGGAVALVLGATSWMIDMLRRHRYRLIIVVDMSSAMLALAESTLKNTIDGSTTEVQFHESKWTDLSGIKSGIDVVLGDNSFSFLKFPDQWELLCDCLADKMTPNATLITRCLSVPKRHERLSMQGIVRAFMSRSSINYTEVRAALLFSQVNRQTYAIDTEQVLEYFESRRADLDPLFSRFPVGPDNDLLTVCKYRDSGAVYYAPPMDDVFDVMGKRFQVMELQFGPYSMSEYFPLFVASRK